ncbi:hydrocephalus-inducing protein [Marchantia polymorpha subsp. ruderalis]
MMQTANASLFVLVATLVGVIQKRPSDLVKEKLDLPIPYRDGKLRLKPQIIERHNFFNLPYQVPSTVSVEEPLFQPFPPQITFVGFKAFHKYHAILQLRNNDKLVRRVMVIPLVSEILTVQPYSHPDLETLTIYDELGVSKVACGMEFSVIVNFCPQSEDDYESEVVVVTEREKFVVPVIGHGIRGVLEMADEINFPPTPVQFNYKKNVMVHNRGTKYANFQVFAYVEDEHGTRHPDIFIIFPLSGKLEPGEFVELELEFKPTKIGFFEGELELTYVDTGEAVFSRLTGTGIELDIGLSTDDLTMKPTHIHTSSERSIFISNFSTSVSHFEFERFATDIDEYAFENGIDPKAREWATDFSKEDELDQNEDEDAPRQQRIFTLNPSKGDLWPGNRLEIVCTFSPQRAKRYFTLAYCTIAGKQDRVPLKIDGEGVGPLAQFFPTKIDLKEVNLLSQYEFDVKLQNTGELEARFQLQDSKSSKEGTRFRFSPEVGSIAVGEFAMIHVSVFLDKRGAFQEAFAYLIDESVNFAPLYFRGDVIDPAIDVEPRKLDFGLVSFGFDCFREFRITNRSHIALSFRLPISELEVTYVCHMHGNTKSIKRPFMCDVHGPESDFVIIPATTMVQPKETVVIVVKLVPRAERKYDAILGVIIEHLDEVFCEVKIKAQCCIPKVSLPYDELHFGKSYIRYTYTKPLELLNESNVPAKYRIIPLTLDARLQANVTASPIEGIVEAFSILTLDIQFTAEKLGDIKLEMSISISGKDPTFLTVKITGIGIGPKLSFFSPSDGKSRSSKASTDPTTLNFGRVKVLETHTMQLEITNISLIPAVFKIFTENETSSVFHVDKSEASLEPNQVMMLQVDTYLDDTMRFEDVLKFTLEGGDYEVYCYATGFGCLLICAEFDSKLIDFGNVLTHSTMTRIMSVQNLGRRPRSLECENITRHVTVHFSVKPATATLQQHAVQCFEVSGTANEACTIEEKLQFIGLVASVRTKAKPEIHHVLVTAEVAALALIFSSPTLRFIQINGPGHEEADETVQSLSCQNIFKEPLHFSFGIKLPYRLSVDDAEIVLQPLETITVNVILDWQRPADKISHTFTSKLAVTYRDTSRKDFIGLIAEIHFPNLQIDTNKIDFGCVTENTSKRCYLEIKNISIMDVHYCWAFLDKHGVDIDTSRDELLLNQDFKIPANRIFDILPIRNILPPGEKETVEFSFYSFPAYKCRALALCEVDGGPNYNVVLEAESSSIKYVLNKMLLNFGVQAFNHPVTSRMLSLTNTGLVPISFELDLSSIKRKQSLQIEPKSGSLKGGEKQKFSLTMMAGVPDRFEEHFNITVEYFHPHNLEVQIEGSYPSILLDTHRVRGHKFLSYVENAWTYVSESKRQNNVYPTKDSSADSTSEVTTPGIPAHRRRESIQRHPSMCVSTCIHGNDKAPDPDSDDQLLDASSLYQEPDIEMTESEEEIFLHEQAMEEAKRKEEAEILLQPTLEEVDAEIDRLMMLQYFYERVIEEPKSTGDTQETPALQGQAVANLEPEAEENNKSKRTVPPATAPKGNKNTSPAVSAVQSGPKAKEQTSQVDDPTSLKLPEETADGSKDKEPVCEPTYRMIEKSGVEIQKLIKNKYCMDFGNVRLGFAKKLALRVTNASILPVAFKVDKSKAKGFGFSIEPDKIIQLLPGCPIPQTTELFITLNTNQPKFPTGKLQCWVHFNIKEGPLSMVLLKANVVTPALILSTYLVDFGITPVGRCKTIYVRFENRGEAACEWKAERPEPGTVSMRVLRDWDYFTCHPDSGKIPPYDFVIVKVLFIPKLQKLKTNYETVMPIRVADIDTPVVLALKGHAYIPPISFEPPEAELGPVIPNAAVPFQLQVELKNRSNQNLEVYSVDFDPQYIQEEEVLRGIKTYNDKNILLIDIREAGQPFWKELQGDTAGAAPNSPKGATSGKGQGKEDAQAKSAKQAKEKKGEDPKSKKGKPAKVSADDIQEESTIGAKGPIILMYGPPLVGKSTQAKMLSLKYKIPILHVESLITSAIKKGKLKVPSQETKAKTDEKVDPKGGKLKEEKGPGMAADKKKDELKVKGKQQGGKKKPDDEDTQKGAKAGGKDLGKEAFQKEVLDMIQVRLNEPDCVAGVIFDGLTSTYGPVLSFITGLLQLLGFKPTTVNVPVPELEHGGVKFDQGEGKGETKMEEKEGKGKANTEGKKEGKAQGKDDAKRKTEAKTVWKGSRTVNLIALTAESPELTAFYADLPETCHSCLKPAYVNEDAPTSETLTPHRLCHHHLHFPALEGAGADSTELVPHLHLESPLSYPYKSVYPTPEDIQKYFESEAEVFAAIGVSKSIEEAKAIGQNVLISSILAFQDIDSIFLQEMRDLPMPPCELPLPSPEIRQVVKRPQVRKLLDDPDFTYSIFTALPGENPSSPKGDKDKTRKKEALKPKKVADTPGTAKGKKKEGAKGDVGIQKSLHEIVPKGYVKQTRWLIPPKTNISLLVQFWSSQVGEFDHTFAFEVMGTLGHQATLFCTGISAYPQITVFYMKFPPRKAVPFLIGVAPKRIPTLVAVPDGKLDFGPINTGRCPAEYPDIPDGEHCKKLCVRNTGLFDLHVDFSLLKVVEEGALPKSPQAGGKKAPGSPTSGEMKEKQAKKAQELAKTKQTGKPGAKKGTKGDANQPVFSIHPPAMDLKIDESKTLSLFAYPREGMTGKLTEKLICKIKENPEPLEFTVTCVSDTPTVQINSNFIDFQRVLLGKRKIMELNIKNTCLLRLRWSITGLETVPPEFEFSETSGPLKAGEEVNLLIAFSSAAEQKFDLKLKVQVTHCKDIAQEHPLRLAAEGYLMNVLIKYPDPAVEDGIDYGTIKVAQEALKIVILENKGKYKVGYKFNLNTQLIRELFTITPLEGELQPKGQLKVTFSFNKNKTLKKETILHRNHDITLDLIEVLYGIKEKTIPIYISLHAVHSKFLILPAREIDFEQQVCGVLSEARTLKILNTGVFEFSFKISTPVVKLPEGGPSDKAESIATKKSTKTIASAKTTATSKTTAGAGKGKKGQNAAPKMIDLRGFQLFPAVGTVLPGMKQDISVYFKGPETPLAVSEEIAIFISEKDPLKYPEDILYLLKGESQFPGFVTDPEVIFEEHRMLDEFEMFPAVLPPRTYSKGDHIFSFGPVFIDTDPPSKKAATEPVKVSVKWSEDFLDTIRTPRPVKVHGADVNFKIMNPFKVPCTVDFTLTPEVVEQETLEAYEVPFAMDIQPQSISVPPLDCSYIQCIFNPLSIRTYAAVFEAIVKNGGDNVKHKQFKCHIRGDGTLPHIQVECPTELSASGAPWLKYPRVKVNQSFTLPIVLHNQGIVPATANILVVGGSVLWLAMSLKTDQMVYSPLPLSSSFKVRSKQRETILVTFTPLEIKKYECELQVVISSNPFNNLNILITAEGYMDEVECLDLPRKLCDEIWFDDGPFNTTKSIAFLLKNNCLDKNWRFTWPVIPFVKFSPATCHLHAGSFKEISMEFNPTEKVEYIDTEIRAPMVNIVYLEGEPPPTQWESPLPDLDMLEKAQAAVAKLKSAEKKGKQTKGVGKDTETKKKGEKEGPAKGGKGKSKNKADKPASPDINSTPEELEVPPEPPHEVVVGSEKAMVLNLHAIADMSRYECEARSIHFKSTMMYQTRTFLFSLKNLSRTELLFNWLMHKQEGDLDEGNLYNISPKTGAVPAESSMTITVKFLPIEVEDCTRLLVCDIPGLDPQWMPLSLPVTGHVTRPWCHFKLPKNDYITGKRRSQALVGPDGEVGPLDPEIKVIEISSLGVHVQNFMTFTAVNPTNIVYKFVWEPTNVPSPVWPEDEPPLQSAVDQLHVPFRCLSRSGEINPGEGYEMSFEFLPVKCELQERFWTFRIPALDITEQFLLVGYVYKPKLHFDHAVVNFGKVQVGTKSKSCIRLINDEETAFPFSFDKTTYLRTQYEQHPLKPVLLFIPSHGTVGPNSEAPIDITFAPIGEGLQNFNVVCNLKKALQLTVNVKAEGYTIHDKVFLEVLNEGIPLQLSPKEVNHLHLGDILINNMVFKKFVLTNTGIFPFHFVWMLGGNKDVVVEPPGGTVTSEEQVFCDFSFCPKSPGPVTDVTVVCQVRHSNQYVLNISGTCYRPRASFSFLDYDFGPTFLDAEERDPPSVELVVSNVGTSAITCENMYESTPHLDVPHATLLLDEGEKESVIITFKPQEVRHYKELVKFQINGLDTVTVVISGEGVRLHVELVDKTQKLLVFDSLKIGQSARIPVEIVNMTRAVCHLAWTPVRARFLELDMVCLPAEGITLKGKQTGTLDLQFRPKARIAPFDEPLVITAANTEVVLATVSGACVGTEVKLSTNLLAFGTVTLGSKYTRKIQVENCGDIGTAFAWDVCTHATECTFFPPEGYLAPHQVAVLEVSFHPTAVHPDIRIERIHCVITGGETQFLTIQGGCMEHDPPVETFSFVAPVRSIDSKTVQLKNITDKPWLLCPKIENRYWSGPCTIEVPARQTVGYIITFHPMTMSQGASHKGSITFPLPDGSALYYKLEGDAGAPLPAGDIQYDVQARKKANIPLKVQNWLKLAQHFVLVIEQHIQDVTTSLTGPKAIEVPGNATRECLLQFHAHKPGTYGSKVTFRNEATKEYIFYNLMVVANKADVAKVINFEAVVRQRIIHTLHIRNPLQSLVIFTAKCENSEVRIPATIEVDPGASTAMDIAYRPLLESNVVSYITLKNDLLGEVVYQLNLLSYSPGFDDTLSFSAPLGIRQTQLFRFIHYLPTKVNYKCEMSAEGKENGFIVPATVSANNADLDGLEVQVPIIFEPSKVGEKNYGVLSVSDPKGGKYSCRLLGTCLTPVPQGPVMVYQKGTVNFRNVFDSTIQFDYVVDNPAFTCSKGEKIAAKKQTKVAITYKKPQAPKMTDAKTKSTDAKPATEAKTTTPTTTTTTTTREASPGKGGSSSSSSSSSSTSGIVSSDRGRLTIMSAAIPYRWVFYLQGSEDPPPKPDKSPPKGRPSDKSPPKPKKK